MSGAILRRRDQTVRSLRVEHYSSAVNRRKRAPRGSVPRFVEQALRDRPGLTPPDILERAVTDMERLIKPPSILTELRNGRRQGRYELSGGRWSLAAPDPGAAGADETASPEATQDSEPGEGESEATPGLNL